MYKMHTYMVWCPELKETEEKAFQVSCRNVYEAVGAWTAFSEAKRNVSKSVLVKIKNIKSEKTHQLFVVHWLK